ncbi:hypothetical protein BAU15_09940 [Enterococcus sp. JM4C]|uniref:hypothetical protein n=1 Tax=Candidatus Enterococcus huntleyi TaxID=1857217 RepID=UPI0013799381|nr:hypothetical protein [Enterococcus sp. JM4C]KAF1298157.1 hypothetical protein BAU15_09940 [Enterococcus sp. JM4C]
MTVLTLSIYDKEGRIRTSIQGEDQKDTELKISSDGLVHLSMRNFSYEEGDQIRIGSSQAGVYLMVKLDETLETSLIYLPETDWIYELSFAKNRVEARPENRFLGNNHYVSARLATKEEIAMYRNLALNPHDQKDFMGAYPHAHANVETRNDATFFACNAIDGIYANHSHGPYPFQSWGINQQADAALTIDFGRQVCLNKVVFTWRADFPHDSYWTKVTLKFSDGTKETFETSKTAKPQAFTFSEKKVSSVSFGDLIQDTDASPFPALTQIEFWGKNG